QFERAQFAGKMSGEDAWILARRSLVRKSRQVFERGGVEAARAEPADRSRPGSPEIQQFPGPCGLRLEPGEGRGHGLGPEPLAHPLRRAHEPPRDAVELHLDSVARPLAQRGDDGYYSADSASPAAATAAAAAAAFAPLPLDEPFSAASSTTGSSRAETTCSGPSSRWVRWRISRV